MKKILSLKLVSTGGKFIHRVHKNSSTVYETASHVKIEST